ncbi:AraC family transcriptional regulator [Paenibacillus cymbidii]|uniref:AraC family transcriptional regulator n=1 Tax=Paenibacillus cymbidii TaxID=1639034 RepID=UPI00143686B7|nr:AraC family transcriptional regulator [Paenibacillus cymbidii]
MNDSILFLLENADIHVLTYDVHTRREIGIYNRVLKSFYMMTYVKRGTAKLRVGNNTYVIRPGTVIFIPPHVEHDQFKDTDEETEFLWWHFTYKIEHCIDVLSLFDIPYVYSLGKSEPFETAFGELMNAMGHRHSITSAIYRKAKCFEVLSILLDSALGHENSVIRPPVTTPFLGILCGMVRHIGSRLTLKDIASELYLNDTYASARFKELFGTSPIYMYRQMKIERAKTLLATADMSVKEIAVSLGFEEVSNFSRFYKSYVGLSPMNYRKGMLSDRHE